MRHGARAARGDQLLNVGEELRIERRVGPHERRIDGERLAATSGSLLRSRREFVLLLMAAATAAAHLMRDRS